MGAGLPFSFSVKSHNGYLLVVVMPVGSKHKYHNCIVKDAVHKPVLLGNASAPPSFGLSFKRFRMTCPCTWMLGQFIEHLHCFIESCWLMS